MSSNSVIEIYQQLCQTPKFELNTTKSWRTKKINYEVYYAPTDTRFHSVDAETWKRINDYNQLRFKLILELQPRYNEEIKKQNSGKLQQLLSEAIHSLNQIPLLGEKDGGQ